MELIYCFYLFSGIIKAQLGKFGLFLPIDLTLLCAIPLIVYLAFRAVRIRQLDKELLARIYGFALLLTFYAWMAISLSYTPVEGYGLKKTFYYGTNVIAFAFPLFYINFNVRKFIQCFMIFIFPLTLIFIGSHIEYLTFEKSGKDVTSFAMYLGLSTPLGAATLLLYLFGDQFYKNKYITVFLFFLGLFLMFLLGGRGPMLSAVLLLTLLVAMKAFKKWEISKLNFSFLLKSGLVLIPLFVFIMSITSFSELMSHRAMLRVNGLIDAAMTHGSSLFKTTIPEKVQIQVIDSKVSSQPPKKVTVPVNQPVVNPKEITAPAVNPKATTALVNPPAVKPKEKDSVNIRIRYINESIALIKASPIHALIGYGIGSYGLLTVGEKIRAYPHNFILEIMVELGVIGLIVFLLFLFYIFRYHIKNTKSYIYLVIPIYFLFVALTTGSLEMPRFMYAFLAFSFLLWPEINRKINQVTQGNS